MIPRVQSSGRFSEYHTSLMMYGIRRRMTLSPRALSISDVILQIPGARLFFSSCTAFFTSSTVTGSVEHSRDGSAACEETSRPRSRLTGGCWSKLLKCSIHREVQPLSLLMIWPSLSYTRDVFIECPEFIEYRVLVHQHTKFVFAKMALETLMQFCGHTSGMHCHLGSNSSLIRNLQNLCIFR